MIPFKLQFSRCLKNGDAVATSDHQNQIGYIFCNKYNVRCDKEVCKSERNSKSLKYFFDE